VCPLCGRRFRTSGGFILHVRTFHRDSLVYGDFCLLCRRGFNGYRGLVNHLVTMARRGDCLHLLAYYLVTGRFNRVDDHRIEALRKCYWVGE